MKKALCMGLIAATALGFISCSGGKKEEVVNETKPVIENNLVANKAEETKDDEINKDEKVEKENENKEINKKLDVEDKDKDKDKEVEEGKKPEVEKPNVEEETKPDKKPEIEKPKPEVEKPAPEIEKPKPEIEKPETDNEDKVERIFRFTYMDVALNNVIVADSNLVTVGQDVAQNLRSILSEISNRYFNGNTLNLTTIENVGGKKIAVVNFGGDISKWYNSMQGSSGGSATAHNLISNILQRNYNGYWIDGVRFTWNGGAMPEFDHVPALAGTSYR